MAKFTKLNIGDSVASGGGRLFRKLSAEQLPSPYGVSLDGDYLSWGDYSCFATSFDILVDGVVKATVSAPTNSFDLSTLGLADGTYSISVVSKADGYLDSDPSEAVSYEVGGDELVGTWVFNDSVNFDTTERWNLQFTDNRTLSVNFAIRHWVSSKGVKTITYYDEYDDGMTVYNHTSGWVNDDLRTINITSKLSEVTNGSTLLAWLKANATKQTSQSDSMVGTWVFNTVHSLPEAYKQYPLQFKSNGKEFVALGYFNNVDQADQGSLTYIDSNGGETYAYDLEYTSSWYNEAYKTIEITSEPTDVTFIEWLKANATKQ